MDDLQSFITLVLLWLASTMAVRIIIAKTRREARLPPSPRALPIIGHIHLLGRSPHRSFHELSTRFGPLIRLSLGSVQCLVVSSPDTAKLFLHTHEASFLNRPRLALLDHLSYPSSDFTFGPHGTHWRFMRKLCVSRLLGGKTLDRLLPVRRDETKRLLMSLLDKSSRGTVLIGREMMSLTNNVVSRMSVGQRCSGDECEAEEMRKLVEERNRLVGGFSNHLSDYLWFCKGFDFLAVKRRAKEFHQKFDGLMEKIMKEREDVRKGLSGRGERVNCDFLDILLDALEDQSLEIRLSRDNIKAFILDIFVAGTGTTAITMEWSLAELINNPEIMNMAREEIDIVVGKTRLVEESDIPNLPYIQAIVKETLRLHPAAPLILRESSQDCVANGYDIKKDTRVFINSWAIGRDPNYWKNPLEFRPERFLGTQENIRGQNFNLLPFGSGRRVCPGASLALQVIHSSLAAIIQCFDWKAITIDGKQFGVVDMEEGQGLALVRANPLICVAVPRLHPFPFT